MTISLSSRVSIRKPPSTWWMGPHPPHLDTFQNGQIQITPKASSHSSQVILFTYRSQSRKATWHYVRMFCIDQVISTLLQTKRPTIIPIGFFRFALLWTFELAISSMSCLPLHVVFISNTSVGVLLSFLGSFHCYFSWLLPVSIKSASYICLASIDWLIITCITYTNDLSIIILAQSTQSNGLLLFTF